MGLKDIPAWTKGGIIGLLFLLVFMVLASVTPSTDMGNVFSFTIGILMLPATMLLIPFKLKTSSLAAYMIMVVYFFLVGSLFGAIVGKLIARNKKN